MSSKRKTRNSKKMLAAKEQFETVLKAIQKAGGCVATFFKQAAEALSAMHFKYEREAEKFARVMREGIEKYRSYKTPRVALEWAWRVLNPTPPEAAYGMPPKVMMRRAPAIA